MTRGVARNFYILKHGICDHIVGSGGMLPQEIFAFILDLFDSIWWHLRLSNSHSLYYTTDTIISNSYNVFSFYNSKASASVTSMVATPMVKCLLDSYYKNWV